MRRARAEGGHGRLLARRAELAVEQHNLELAQLSAAQPFVLGRRGACLKGFGLLDQWTDHEGLAARAELLADALVCPCPFPWRRAHKRLNGPAPPRKLPQDGEVEVAVPRERQRAWDRRRAHVEHVQA